MNSLKLQSCCCSSPALPTAPTTSVPPTSPTPPTTAAFPTTFSSSTAPALPAYVPNFSTQKYVAKNVVVLPSSSSNTHAHTSNLHTAHTHSLTASIEHFVSHFLMRLISFFSCFFFSAPCNFFPSSSSCLALFHFCANSMKNFSIMYTNTNTNTNTNTCAQSTHSPHI